MTHDNKPKRTPHDGRERHAHADDITTVAIFVGTKRTRPKTLGDRLGELCLEWAWATGHRDWEAGVRTLARTLKGLDGAGLIERHRVHGDDEQPLHLLRLTPLGQQALALLSGDDSEVQE
jgi:hypothetical protein